MKTLFVTVSAAATPSDKRSAVKNALVLLSKIVGSKVQENGVHDGGEGQAVTQTQADDFVVKLKAADWMEVKHFPPAVLSLAKNGVTLSVVSDDGKLAVVVHDLDGSFKSTSASHAQIQAKLVAALKKLDSTLVLAEADSEVDYFRFDFEGRAEGKNLPKSVTDKKIAGMVWDGYDEDGYACWETEKPYHRSGSSK